MITNVFFKAKAFIYKNARPLDYARFKFLFENGNKNDVLDILKTYQNEDGGFAFALEEDSWNKNSSPIQTWVATEIILELNIIDSNTDIIQGILKYLNNGKDFNGHYWKKIINSNNDYPHAPWWHYNGNDIYDYNPTACLAGFILKYASTDSELYQVGCRIAKEAYEFFINHYPHQAMHTVFCFKRLYDYCVFANKTDLFDMNNYYLMLDKQIKYSITIDKESWKTDYVCRPSKFIDSKENAFYLNNKDIADYECQFIIDTQEEDGSWSINWNWDNYIEQWHISKNFWKSDGIITNLLYLKNITNLF